MSRGFVKEGDQEEVPMVLPRAFLPSGTPNYVTPEGLKKLHDEMESLKKEWTEAGSNYVAKNHIDAKVRQLSERINSAVVIDNTKANPDVISFGMYVKYNDKVIRIVGVDEADASKGLVSFISPIAKSLIGKKKGDKFEVRVPRGIEVVEVQEVAVFIGDELRAMSRESLSQVVQSSKSEAQNSKPIAQSTEPKAQSSTTVTVESKRAEDVCDTSLQVLNSSDSKPTFLPETNPTDFLPLVNEQGNIIGRALLCEIHNGNKVLHPAVHLLVYNTKKEIVAKYWWHVAFGETAEKTLKRKLKEIESQTIKPKFKKQYIREDKNEKELVSVFTATTDEEIMPSPSDKEYEAMFLKSAN